MKSGETRSNTLVNTLWCRINFGERVFRDIRRVWVETGRDVISLRSAGHVHYSPTPATLLNFITIAISVIFYLTAQRSSTFVLDDTHKLIPTSWCSTFLITTHSKCFQILSTYKTRGDDNVSMFFCPHIKSSFQERNSNFNRVSNPGPPDLSLDALPIQVLWFNWWSTSLGITRSGVRIPVQVRIFCWNVMWFHRHKL